jgi:hypothetical protein
MRLAETGVVQNFDIAPDGKRIVALMPDSSLDEQRAAWSSCRTSPTRYGGALADHGHADPENRRGRQTQDSSTLN